MSSWVAPDPKNRQVAVLGAGVLGRRIACTWVAGGYHVSVYDPVAKQADAALEYVRDNVSAYFTKAATKPGNIAASSKLEDAVKNAWLVIEAVPEKLDLKMSLFAQLESLVAEDAILTTNSSSYKSREIVSDLKPATRARSQNLHFMMPPQNRVVELMTDGETYPEIFPFLTAHLKEVGLHPITARKESTGFVVNRLWAAIKREVMTILAEGVSVPDELDPIFVEMWGHSEIGPCAQMDKVGLDTVAFIEDHYIKERHLSGEYTVDWLRKNYVNDGKLGEKTGNGGLYPASASKSSSNKEATEAHPPTLYFLDIGMSAGLENVMHSGRILSGSPDGRPLRVLVDNEATPDGVDVCHATQRLYWTCMGVPSENDGCIRSCSFTGEDVQTIVPVGKVHTPKQLVVYEDSSKPFAKPMLYFCDREGMRVMRVDVEGTLLETLVQTGDLSNKVQAADQRNHCVGITVAGKAGKMYWTQKGPSKAFAGRIMRANMEMPKGSDAKSRKDIECIFQGLPEPIDLAVDEEGGYLYWTDRGELPLGNSLNRAKISSLSAQDSDKPRKPGEGYEILARNMHEAIGLCLDTKNRHIYSTDMGGAVYRFDLDMEAGAGKGRRREKKIYEQQGESTFTGITMLYVD